MKNDLKSVLVKLFFILQVLLVARLMKEILNTKVNNFHNCLLMMLLKLLEILLDQILINLDKTLKKGTALATKNKRVSTTYYLFKLIGVIFN